MSFEFDIGLTASQIPDVISALRYAHRKGVGAGRGRRQHRGHAGRLPGAGAARDRGRARRPSTAASPTTRTPAPGLDLVAPGRRRGRVDRRRPELQAARGPGPRRLPVHVPRARARAASACRAATRARRWRCRTWSGTVALMIGAKVLGPRPVARGDRAAARDDRARPRRARLRPALRLGPAERGRARPAAAPP